MEFTFHRFQMSEGLGHRAKGIRKELSSRWTKGGNDIDWVHHHGR
jgi:hypothetical protein